MSLSSKRLLALLIVGMVATASACDQSSSNRRQIDMTVLQDGHVHVAPDETLAPAKFSQWLPKEINQLTPDRWQASDLTVYLDLDPNATFGDLLAVVDACQQLGIQQFRIRHIDTTYPVVMPPFSPGHVRFALQAPLKVSVRADNDGAIRSLSLNSTPIPDIDAILPAIDKQFPPSDLATLPLQATVELDTDHALKLRHFMKVIPKLVGQFNERGQLQPRFSTFLVFDEIYEDDREKQLGLQ